MDKKKLVVNTAVCDMSAVKEETLKAYESITVNAATVLVSEASGELIDRYNVTMNAADIISVPGDGADVSTKNGTFEIHPGETPAKPTLLIVNGTLTVEEGAADALQNYVSITVNGSLLYPKSMAGAVAKIHVNGSSNCYPDGAIRLKRNFVADRTFLLRAKRADYFAARRVVLLDEQVDVKALAEKGVHFITKTALIAESKLADAVAMFDDDTEIIVLPDGCAFINEDTTLNDTLLRRFGGKLYINGDLDVEKKSAAALKKVQFLRVNGSVSLAPELEEEFLALDAEYDELILRKGTCISDRLSLKLTKMMLEAKPDGISVSDCAEVALAPDISPEMILSKLTFSDCAVIHCSEEQSGAVELVSEGVAQIDDSGKEGGLKGVLNMLGGDPDTKYINAANYKM